MDIALRLVVEAIHVSPQRAVLILSGGASQAVGWLLSVPGASNTLLEATVPYSRRSMAQTLGQVPPQYVSRSAAQEIALAAYNRAIHLSPPGIPVLGVGFTGALASVPPKRGDHRCFVAARSQGALWEYSLTLTKGHRDRYGEDNVTSRLLLQALADASGVPAEVPLELEAGEGVERAVAVADARQQVEQLLRGDVPLVTFPFPGEGSAASRRRVVLPGSFNPLHEGHLALMAAACSTIPDSVACFEISAINADKPPLAVEEILRRVNQFTERGLMVVVTSQPFFYQKSELLPDSTFAIGYDTAIRLINPKYYGESWDAMIQSLKGIQRNGCDFMVAGRLTDGKFHELSEVEIPAETADLFRAIPETRFRRDISSTELRARQKNTS